MSVCFCICQCVDIFQCVSVSVNVYAYVSVFLYLSMCRHMSVCFCICQCVRRVLILSLCFSGPGSVCGRGQSTRRCGQVSLC